MTPEAKLFIEEGVQELFARMRSSRYQSWQLATTIREVSIETAVDTAAPLCLYWRDMMLLGSLLLPEEPAPAPTVDVPNPVAPAFYLDSPLVRELIQTELAIPARAFLHECHVATWAALLNTPGARALGSQIPRRFYVVDKDADFPWGATMVPWQSEKDADDSTVPADAVVLPDFLPVVDSVRYRAIGL